MAEHLAASGWNVIIHYNASGQEAADLANTLSMKYPKQNFGKVQVNLAESGEVVTLIAAAIRLSGGIDLLVNNASVFSRGYFAETSMELLSRSPVFA